MPFGCQERGYTCLQDLHLEIIFGFFKKNLFVFVFQRRLLEMFWAYRIGYPFDLW